MNFNYKNYLRVLLLSNYNLNWKEITDLTHWLFVTYTISHRMTNQPRTNSKKQLKPTKSYPTTNNVNSTILTAMPASIPMLSFREIPSRDLKASVALGAKTVLFTSTRLGVKKLIRRNYSRHSSVWVGEVAGGGTEVQEKDLIYKCMCV